MFFKLIARFQFLVQSTNQHGVHSPFVFDFVIKGLYQKSTRKDIKSDILAIQNLSKKEQLIFSKVNTYFHIDAIYTSFNKLENTLDKNYKLLFINNLVSFNFDKLTSFTSKTIVLIHGIYNNKKTQEKWLSICQHPNATVTIDLFYFGLIFFRKEQAKEHFKIRV